MRFGQPAFGVPKVVPAFVLAAFILGAGVFGCSSGAKLDAGNATGQRTAGQTAAGQPATLATNQWTQVIDPFDVYDEQGRPYRFPFLGGLNVPRTQLVDIDGDGDLDLFMQEFTGELVYFENEGTATDPQYVHKSVAYQGLDIGEWFRFADMDQDGDYDLLAEKRFSYIRYFQNTGSATNPQFDHTLYALKDTADADLFSDRQNIPNVTDIDCNGKLDLFVGRVDGTIYRYEAVDEDARGFPRFALVSTRFENIEIIGEIQVGASLHGANTMAFADFDQDGDEDLFWGDFFESGLLLIENSGSCAAPALQNEPVRFPRNAPIRTSGYNAPAFGDLDGNGHLDMLVGVLGGAFNPTTTSADNLYRLEHTTGREFEIRTTRFLDGVDVGMESIPALADVDGDGDLDLFLSNKIDPVDGTRSLIYYFENRGTADNPEFHLADTLSFGESYHLSPAFGDLDADGDLDIIVGTWTNGMMLVRNEGTATSPAFVVETEQYLSLTRGSNATPTLVDIDGDGDLDLFVGEASGELNYYENVGTPESARFSFVTDNFAGLDAGRRSFIDAADIDADGDYDLIVTRDVGAPILLRNVGTPTKPEFVEDGMLGVKVPTYTTARLVDLDGDGFLDIVAGAGGGGVLFYSGSRNN